MKKIFLFLGIVLIVGLLAGCGHEKDQRIKNLVSQNEELTAKVTSLEQEKKDGEAREDDLKTTITSLEGDVCQREWFIKKLAVRLPLTTVANEAATFQNSSSPQPS